MQTLNKGNKLNANQSLMQKNCMLETMPNQNFFFNFFFLSINYEECVKYGWDFIYL